MWVVGCWCLLMSSANMQIGGEVSRSNDQVHFPHDTSPPRGSACKKKKQKNVSVSAQIGISAMHMLNRGLVVIVRVALSCL